MNQGQYQGIVAELQEIKALLQLLVDRLPQPPVLEQLTPDEAEQIKADLKANPQNAIVLKGARRGAKLQE